jgi:hypothetical protein
MKPIASAPNMTLPIAAGLAGLPLLIEAPLWGCVVTAGAAFAAYGAWRREVDRRPPLPALLGDTFEPLDITVTWRTTSGVFPASRHGWRALLTESDLWLSPMRHSRLMGGDREYVRVPRLDVLECRLASDTEIRLRFVDDEGRAQEGRLSHVPRAQELATALGYEEDSSTQIWDRG